MLPTGDTEGVDADGAPGWERIRAVAVAAEAAGLDSIWLADHFFYRTSDGAMHGLHEAWSTLSALAAVTTRVELGPLVLCASFRNPGLVAKMAVTLDMISGGRLILGLGSGWYDPEYAAFGFPADRRVARFAERLEVTARLLRGETVTFEGEFERTSAAVLAPAPGRRMPLLVAAEGPRMLSLTARWADAWVTAWYGAPNDMVGAQLANLERALAAEGRSSVEVERIVGITVRDKAQPAVAEPEEDAIDGDVDDLARVLQAYADLGIDHVVAGLEPATRRSVERLAEARRLT